MDAKQLDVLIKKEIRKVGERVAAKLMQPTDTWQHKPEFFVSNPVVIGGNLECHVRTRGTRDGDNQYFWLDEGTDIRYATMTTDFSPKTKVRSFVAMPGSGKKNYVSRMVGRPGIQARQWTIMAAQEYGVVLQIVVDRALSGYKGKPSSFGRGGGRQFVP